VTRSTWLLGILAVALAAVGVTDHSDSIVPYVVRVVDGMDWMDLWKPAFDPPPMNTYTYRPFTVLLVKLQLLVTGRDEYWMTVIHVASLLWLVFAIRRFLRAHNMEKVAPWAAASTVLLPSMLFATWIPVESDCIGAAFICEAGWALHQWLNSKQRKHLLIFIVAAFGAGTTKESSAAAMFGYLSAMLWVYRKDDVKRLFKAWIGYSVALTLAVIPLLLAKGGSIHDFNVQSQEFAIERAYYMTVHVGNQLFYIVSSAGIALIFLAQLMDSKHLKWVFWVVFVVIAICPTLRVYNHYESVIIDQLWYVGPLILLLIATLIWTTRSENRDHAVMAWSTLFLLGVLISAPILLRQTRPDVSARLLAPLAPMLHALAWAGGFQLWNKYKDSKVRWAAGYLVGCFVLFPVFGAISTIGAYSTRMEVEKAGKELAAKQLKTMQCPLLISTNRDHELSVEELQRMGVPWSECNTLFFPNQVRLDAASHELFEKRPGVRWKMQGHTYSLRNVDLTAITESLLNQEPPERCALLYVQTARARMDTHEFERFSGDFGWAFHNLPEFDEELYVQQVEIQYREATDYEDLFKQSGARRFQMEQPYSVFPLNPNEWLWRAISGFPIIEDYAYEANSYVFESCNKSSH